MTIITTPGSIAAISPDSTAFHAFDVLGTSLINTVGTLVSDGELNDRAVIRIPHFGDPDELDFVAEGEEIPESTTGLKEITVGTKKLATLHSASNEALRSGAGRAQGLGSMISTHVLGSLRTSADAKVFGDALVTTVSGAKLHGLGMLAGVTTAELGDNLDVFTDAFLNVMAHGGAEEDISVVAHPTVWAHVTRLKETGVSNRPLLDAVSGTTVVPLPNTEAGLIGPQQVTARTIYGRPVFLSRHATLAGILVVDRKNIVTAAEPARVDVSEHAKFSRDSTDIRGTERIGWQVHNPARVTRITIPATAP
ncbi:MAG: phage major capsid protein [Corynebacterium humireducens]|jgi:HK97 family phage major capsid protein|uniref:Phage major capsid protein n=1 Tax=Corynebacterium humireducens TaxID=1223514 RepID=A0A7X6PMA6_9CORY|nr:phage major capsid protein [Corynebacterium humireducens]